MPVSLDPGSRLDDADASDEPTDDRDDPARDDDDREEMPNEDGDERLDAQCPLGEGVADVAATVWCPYCGEAGDVALDPGGGAHQEYVEDCAVCCQPWRVTVRYLADGSAHVSADTADGA